MKNSKQINNFAKLKFCIFILKRKKKTVVNILRDKIKN